MDNTRMGKDYKWKRRNISIPKETDEKLVAMAEKENKHASVIIAELIEKRWETVRNEKRVL